MTNMTSSTGSMATSSLPVTGNRFADALSRVRAELSALEPAQLLPITVEPTNAAVMVRGHWAKLSLLRSELEKLSDFDIKCLDNLPDYLDAWLLANAQFLGTSLPPEGLAALVEKVSSYRSNLIADAEVLIKRGVLGSDVLSQLKGPSGHRNIASDVLTLTNIFRSNWQTIGGRTCVTIAELDDADASMSELLTDLGVREMSPAAREANALLRQQAYTMFVSAYDKVRRAVSYLRWEEDDADDYAPSLFGGRKKRGGTEVQKPAETAPVTTPSATTVTAGTVTAALSSGVAAAKPGVGLPGADPFTH